MILIEYLAGYPSRSLVFTNFFAEGLCHELPLDELFVGTTRSNQLVVRALLKDLALAHYDNLVGVPDGGESVGDDDAGLSGALHEGVEGLLYLMLTLGIQGACRLIQEDDLRPAHQSPSDCDPLLLAT